MNSNNTFSLKEEMKIFYEKISEREKEIGTLYTLGEDYSLLNMPMKFLK